VADFNPESFNCSTFLSRKLRKKRMLLELEMKAIAVSPSPTAFHHPAMEIVDKRDIYGGMPWGVDQTKHHNVVVQAQNYLQNETWFLPRTSFGVWDSYVFCGYRRIRGLAVVSDVFGVFTNSFLNDGH